MQRASASPALIHKPCQPRSVFWGHSVVVGSEQRVLKVAKPPLWDVVVSKNVSEFDKPPALR